MPYSILDNTSCHLKVPCGGEEGLSSVGKNQSPNAVLRPLTEVQGVDQTSYNRLPNVDDALRYVTMSHNLCSIGSTTSSSTTTFKIVGKSGKR